MKAFSILVAKFLVLPILARTFDSTDSHLALFNKPIPPAGIVSLSIHHDGVAIVHLDAVDQEKPEIRYCHFQPLDSIEHFSDVLNQLVEEQGLQGVPCHWVLQPGDYQLLLEDVLDVPPHELSAAAKWHVKDLLDMPLREAAIDTFVVPEHGITVQRNKMYVVASQISRLQKFSDLINESGLHCQKIDIAELCLRRVGDCYADGNETIALMTLKPKNNLVIISKENQLYLSRLLDFELLDTEITKDNLLLEAQRSYDYCESELELMPPATFFLSPAARAHPELFEYLKTNLRCDVRVIDLHERFTSTKLIDSAIQARCLAAVGGALQ